jgi:dTDP-4-amino-4,6-dideoxygalactose transaminase
MMAEALDEGRDCLVMRDIEDLEMHIQETSDVVMQWFTCSVTYALKVVLVARLVTRGDEVVDEGLLELRLAIKLVL